SNLKWALVGKFWLDNTRTDDNHERIEIINPFFDPDDQAVVTYLQKSGDAIVDPTGFIHPDHNLKERKYDVMLMKLRSPSLKPTVKVNFDPNIPAKKANGNEIVVIGLGRTEVGGPKPDLLQQVYLDFLPYEECIDSAAYNVDYKFELLPDMICTHGVGLYNSRGQCYGDSGGPYLDLGNGYEQDVQVGVVSWAVNCASPVFPMVGSRTSASEKFIRDVTCAITVDPTTRLCVGSDSVIQPDVVEVSNGVPVSVNVYSDPFGHEISWQILSADQSKVYAQRGFGSIKGDHDFFEVKLPAGQDFVFSIKDAADDGIFGDQDAVLYEIVLLDQDTNIVLMDGDGLFKTGRRDSFRVPTPDEYAALVPAPDRSGWQQFIIPEGTTIKVFVQFVFAEYHEDLSWSITDADDETKVYAKKNYDFYRYGDRIIETVELPKGKYHFTVHDRRGTDDYRAFEEYRLSYQADNGDYMSILESKGVFLGEVAVHEFNLPLVGVGDRPNVNPDDGAISVCTTYMLPCNHHTDCCSGRCAAGVCRAPTTDPRKSRNRLGRMGRGGGASRTQRTGS
ncbi:MAG: hypothetical protein SGILL_008552, partial [Bacillariaceae sp.]